jgi:hypothetical protein
MSRAEAARLYCEDKGLVGSTPEVILAYIKAQYRPSDTAVNSGIGRFPDRLFSVHKIGRPPGGRSIRDELVAFAATERIPL